MRSRYTLFAALAYLAITIAVTYPVTFQLATHIAGLPGNDSLEFVWSMWWFKHALLDLHSSPINISVLNYPDGLTFPLLPTMSQSFVLGLPLTALVSPVFAFNIVYLLSFPACALAGYWLCYDLTQDRRAAFLGGLIWGFFPSKSAHALAGHLFQLVVFTLPLAALFLLRAIRQPSIRNSILAGIFIALAATVHPVNVAYFLLPLILVIILFILWDSRKIFITNRQSLISNLQSLLITGLTALLLTLPLFLPTLLSRDQLGFLTERGVVGFSLDLLTFILPAPFHPLLNGTSLADYIRQVNFFEFEHVGYLGFVPLILGAIALRSRWRESRVWLTLGLVTAILSLGPILHIGRQTIDVPVETDRVPILLPYAYLSELPFFQWSRTPGRLNETTVFSLMIMAAFGLQTLLSRIKNQKAGWAVWLIACLLIPVEYLVRWPMPTTPIPSSPALIALANDGTGAAVMDFPVSDNTVNLIALMQQTIHQHPLVGGRVYRDQPGALELQNFLSQLILASNTEDIAPVPTNDQRLDVFNYYSVSHIIYQPLGDPDGSARTALDSVFGSPASTDDVVSIYKISTQSVQSPVSSLFFIFGSNWYAPDTWQAPTRWFKGIATLYMFSPQTTEGALSFTAIPGNDLRRLLIKVNGLETARFAVGDWGEYQTPSFRLSEGVNTIQFFDEDGSWQYVGDPRCQHGSPVAGPFPYEIPCNAADTEPHDYSLAIQNLRFGPQPTAASALTTFGDSLELLNASAPKTAQAGEAVIAHFTWRTSTTPSIDYTMFVHVLDSNGQLVAGNDSTPARGGFPTTRWQANQIVSYNVPLTLPADLLAGTYTVEVGWYAWPSLENLLTPEGAASFQIGIIEITP